MEATTIDGQMSIQLPEGFSVMETEQVQQLFGLGYTELWGARDEERHIMLACVWKDAPALLAKMVSSQSLLDRAKKSLAKTYAHSDYHFDGYFDTQIAGREAQGFSYSFAVGDVPQQGEVIIVRDERRTYTLYYYTRPECAEDNREIRDQLLSSMTLG